MDGWHLSRNCLVQFPGQNTLCSSITQDLLLRERELILQTAIYAAADVTASPCNRASVGSSRVNCGSGSRPFRPIPITSPGGRDENSPVARGNFALANESQPSCTSNSP